MDFHSMIFGVYSLLCLIEDAVEGLVEPFENADEDPSVISDNFGSMADDAFQRMGLRCFLSRFHIKNE